MERFETTAELDGLLAEYRSARHGEPLDVSGVRAAIVRLLEYLGSAEGRTDGNCQATDHCIGADDVLWDRIDEIQARDPVLADVLGDMAGALHDTVGAPDIAHNVDSTPEQLLARMGRSHDAPIERANRRLHPTAAAIGYERE